MAIPLSLASADTPEPWQAAQPQALVYARVGLPTAPRRSRLRMIGASFWWVVCRLAWGVWLAMAIVTWTAARLLWILAHAVRFALLALARLVESLPWLLSIPVRLGRRLMPGRVPYARLA